jgi:hypothetical protein
MKSALFIVGGIAIGVALAPIFGFPSSTGGLLGAVVGIAAGIWTGTHK